MSDEFTKDLAVVLGIGAYGAAMGMLETPARDAAAVASLLESRFGYEVILRRDGEATLAGLRTLLRDELPERVPAAGFLRCCARSAARPGDSFLGVAVPPGRHRVVIEIPAWPEQIAAVIALLAFAGALAVLRRAGPPLQRRRSINIRS